MSATSVAGLGAIAGLTIFLGLPFGRLRSPSIGLRAFLNAAATGILLFLLWDVLSHAIAPVETALKAAIDGARSWAAFAGLAAVLAVGLAIGLVGLVYYERWMGGSSKKRNFGPGAAAAGEFATRFVDVAAPARRLAVLIALGIGLHNFSEGLAIGQSATKGEINLAVLLIVGFGLHNATEGFGIVAPLAVGSAVRPSWGFLAMLGWVGGAPTFLGTVLGQSVRNDVLYLGFLALAGGSILYVIVQLLGVGAKLGRRQALYWGLLVGLLAGFATNLVVTAGGA